MMNSDKLWNIYMQFYDAFLPKLVAYNELLDTNIELVRSAIEELPYRDIRITELGCGTGNLTVKLIEMAKTIKDKQITVMGADLVPEALARAHKKTGSDAVYFKCDLAQKKFGLDDINYANLCNSHIVIMNNVLFALGNMERNQVMKEIKSILHKDGFVISSEPVKPLCSKTIIQKQGGILRFISTLAPVLIQAGIIILINKLRLVKLVPSLIRLKALFTLCGYRLNTIIENAYAGSNVIQVLQLNG